MRLIESWRPNDRRQEIYRTRQIQDECKGHRAKRIEREASGIARAAGDYRRVVMEQVFLVALFAGQFM